MRKREVCVSGGNCVGNAYRAVLENAARLSAFLGGVAGSVLELLPCGGLAERAARPPSGPVAPGQSPGQLEAVFNHAMRRFQSPDPAVRAAALRVFERLGLAESLALASALLSDPVAGVRARAREIMRALNPGPGRTAEPGDRGGRPAQTK